ncbi:MAG: hypothetical protein RR846_10670 [Oscillospiraceae bacterium]
MNKEDLENLVWYLNNTKRSKTQQFLIDQYVLKKLVKDDTFALDASDHFADKLIAVARCIQDAKKDGITEIKSSELYMKYCSCIEIGQPVSMQAFGRIVKDMGIEFIKKTSGVYYFL